MSELKAFIKIFIALVLTEYNKYKNTIAQQEQFDKIEGTPKGLIELAKFLDTAMADHAVMDYSEPNKIESPRAATMSKITERQDRYILFLTKLCTPTSHAADKIGQQLDELRNAVDVTILNEFKEVLLECIQNSESHILKRTKSRSLLLTRSADVFKDKNTRMEELKTLLCAASEDPAYTPPKTII